MSKALKTTYYVLLVIISVGFIFSALPKLTGNPMAVAGFAQAHLPVWFMYVVGVLELLGAIGLWIRKTAFWSAIGLFVILAGALVVTVIFQGVALAIIPAIYAIVLGVVLDLEQKL